MDEEQDAATIRGLGHEDGGVEVSAHAAPATRRHRADLRAAETVTGDSGGIGARARTQLESTVACGHNLRPASRTGR